MNMHDYLVIVSEQIRCKRAWPMIEKELKDHIEDQKIDCMAEGMTAREAEEEAVRQMGNPVETGMSLNQVHRPLMDWKLVAVVFFLGIVGLVLQWMTYQQPDSAYKSMEIWNQVKYTVCGFVIMLVICLADYSIIGRYALKIWKVVLGIEVLIWLLNLMQYGVMWMNGGLYSPVTTVADCLLLPAFCGMLWSYRGSGNRGIVKSVGWLAVIGAVFMFPFQRHAYALIIFGLCGVMLCMTIWEGWFDRQKKTNQRRDRRTVSIVFGVILLVMVGVALLFWMEKSSFGMGESYEAMRENIQNLASMDKAGVDLTGSELEWARFEVRGDFLWLYLFYSYGIFPVILLTILAFLFLMFLFLSVFHQKNHLGFVLGLGCLCFIAIQTIWYLGMNCGIFPAGQGYMPFCTLGGANMTITYFYTGILLSIYRNSRVVRN